MLAVLECWTYNLAVTNQGKDDDGNGNERQERQPDVHGKQNCGNTNEGDAVHNDVWQCVGDHALKQVCVVDDSRHQLPGLLILIETKRKLLDMFVNQAAGIRNDTPSSFVGGVGANKLHPCPGNKNNQGDDGYAGNKIESILVERLGCELFNQQTDDPGYQKLRADQSQHGQRRNCDQFAIFLGKFAQQCKWFQNCVPPSWDIMTVALLPQRGIGMLHEFRKILSSIQKRPVPAVTQELMKPQGV